MTIFFLVVVALSVFWAIVLAAAWLLARRNLPPRRRPVGGYIGRAPRTVKPNPPRIPRRTKGYDQEFSKAMPWLTDPEPPDEVD